MTDAGITRAMVLAAGLGTRLRPLTDDRPKALVKLAGRTLLDITLARLAAVGVQRVVVNAHHFAEQMAEYVAGHDGYGMELTVSQEAELLDTGGGLKHAARFFAGDDEPFLLHNVDIVSGIDLAAMAAAHRESGALATLAVQERASSRQLLFDGEGRLAGRTAGAGKAPEVVREAGELKALAFAGIHVISPRIFGRMPEEGAFSIIPAYLRLAAEGERVAAYRADGVYWRDLGKVESLRAAEADVAAGVLQLD